MRMFCISRAQIGVTVSQSSQDVRNDFVKKVYSVLFLQIVSFGRPTRKANAGADAVTASRRSSARP